MEGEGRAEADGGGERQDRQQLAHRPAASASELTVTDVPEGVEGRGEIVNSSAPWAYALALDTPTVKTRGGKLGRHLVSKDNGRPKQTVIQTENDCKQLVRCHLQVHAKKHKYTGCVEYLQTVEFL